MRGALQAQRRLAILAGTVGTAISSDQMFRPPRILQRTTRAPAFCDNIKADPEPSFDVLRRQLEALPQNQRRAVQAVLGLALGDAVGLPFELGRGTPHRAAVRDIPDLAGRQALALKLIELRCSRMPDNPFARSYSDDTACCDLKMQAVANAEDLINRAGTSSHARAELQKALLQQYLKWAYSAKQDDKTHGPLFQGYGGFTFDFLIPTKRNAIGKALGNKPPFTNSKEYGRFWPTNDFVIFATGYFKGEHGFPSWGNGAVMSLAPHPILSGEWRNEPAPHPDHVRNELRKSASLLSESHQEATAALAADLMSQLMLQVLAGQVESSKDLKAAFRGLARFRDLLAIDHECIPVAAILEWLEKGDCSVETAKAFLTRLVGPDSNLEDPFRLQHGAPHGRFGRLLRVASDWDNDHGLMGADKLKRRGSSEPVLFSQRGLNSLIIALWAADSASKPWDYIDRIIYVGGDTDTVGAVAGQIAAPLLQSADVVADFQRFVALDSGRSSARSLQVVNAAARRLFRRAIAFVAEDYGGLRQSLSATDPYYPELTSPEGQFL